MEYELMYLVAEKDREKLPEIATAVNDTITAAGAALAGEAFSFNRKLAYEIKHNWRGTFVVQRFTLGDKDAREESLGAEETAPDTIAEVTRQLNLRKDILRHIIVNAEKLPPLADFIQQMSKDEKEGKKVLKEKGEKIDAKLEKVLKI